MSKKKLALIVLDGVGVGSNDSSNPIHLIQPQNLNKLSQTYPYGTLQASGIAAGLGWNEEGRSEISHLLMGAGRVIYQNYPKISLAINNRTFYKNQILVECLDNLKNKASNLHLIGLLSSLNSESSFAHLIAIINFIGEFISQNKLPSQICLHLSLDSNNKPEPAESLLEKITKLKTQFPFLEIKSLCGRYFALDTTEHFDRIKESYETILGTKPHYDTFEKYFTYHKERGLEAEKFPGGNLGTPYNLKPEDTLFFFNFKEASVKELSSAFLDPNFNHFEKEAFPDLKIITLTNYSNDFKKALVVFPEEKISDTVSEIISRNHLNQLKITESVRGPEVTYYWNGLKETPLENEYRIIIPSDLGLHPETKPEMMSAEITSRIIQSIEDNEMDFILANFPNGDIIGHTGDFEASKKVVSILDEALDLIVKSALAKNWQIMIAGSHGNLEKIIDSVTGYPDKKHNPNPVPVYIISNELLKTPNPGIRNQSTTDGIISDIGATVLDLLDLPKPESISGKSLLKVLR